MRAPCLQGQAANSRAGHKPNATPWRDIGDARVRPQTRGAFREPQPDRALHLHPPGERAIVDDRLANGFDAARPCQGLALDQHAAPAAAAVCFFGSFAQAKGNSMSKKKTKAGMRNRSANSRSAAWPSARSERTCVLPRGRPDGANCPVRARCRHREPEIIGRLFRVGMRTP